MKKILPEYIVNCFLSSGYNEISVICKLDVTDNPSYGISIQKQPGCKKKIEALFKMASVKKLGNQRGQPRIGCDGID